MRKPSEERKQETEAVRILYSLIDNLFKLLDEDAISGYKVNVITGLSPGTLSKWRKHEVEDIFATTFIKAASCVQGGLLAVILGMGIKDFEAKKTKTNDSIALLDETSLKELDDYIRFLLFKQKERTCGLYLSGKMPDDEYP